MTNLRASFTNFEVFYLYYFYFLKMFCYLNGRGLLVTQFSYKPKT